METKIKNGLVALVMIVLFLPMTQHSLQFMKGGELKGGYKNAEDAPFSARLWLEGSYQYHETRYLNDMTGFRADLVRLNNQLDFSLFDKCHSVWTVKGRNNELFQKPYIDAYYGNDFIGWDTITEKSLKLKAIQDTLSRLGKSLILVFAPSKATAYPDYFPENLAHEERHRTNFDAYKHMADSLGINYVDMNTWFAHLKDTSKELVFSKQGIHWTSYGAILAGDSLMRYVARLRNIHIAHPVWHRVEHTDKPRWGDDDIAAELNLIFPAARETFCYPVIEDITDTTAVKPNMIYIGDSYGFKMVEKGIVNKMNRQCERWSYFNQVVDVNGHNFYYMNEYDWHGAMKRTGCVVLLYTTFNLTNLGSGFIEAAYDYYYPGKK